MSNKVDFFGIKTKKKKGKVFGITPGKAKPFKFEPLKPAKKNSFSLKLTKPTANPFLFKPVKLATRKNVLRVKRKNLTYPQAVKKYPKIKPFGDADKDGKLNMFDCKPFDKKRHGTFYHVTLEKSVPKLKEQGIKFQKVGNYVGAHGQELRDKGDIYAFKHRNDARRWADKTEFELSEKPSIVSFDEPDESERVKKDYNPEMQMFGRGSAIKVHGDIAPEQMEEEVENFPISMDTRNEMRKDAEEYFKEREGKSFAIYKNEEEEVAHKKELAQEEAEPDIGNPEDEYEDDHVDDKIDATSIINELDEEDE